MNTVDANLVKIWAYIAAIYPWTFTIKAANIMPGEYTPFLILLQIGLALYYGISTKAVDKEHRVGANGMATAVLQGFFGGFPFLIVYTPFSLLRKAYKFFASLDA